MNLIMEKAIGRRAEESKSPDILISLLTATTAT